MWNAKAKSRNSGTQVDKAFQERTPIYVPFLFSTPSPSSPLAALPLTPSPSIFFLPFCILHSPFLPLDFSILSTLSFLFSLHTIPLSLFLFSHVYTILTPSSFSILFSTSVFLITALFVFVPFVSFFFSMRSLFSHSLPLCICFLCLYTPSLLCLASLSLFYF